MDYGPTDAAVDSTPSGRCPDCAYRFRGYDFAMDRGEFFLVIDRCPTCSATVEWDGERVVLA